MEAKGRGNRLFSQKQYKEALESYSSALSKTPRDSHLFANRALCHIKLGQWDSVIEDCQSAIQIDSTSLKAHFYLGQAHMEMANYDSAIEAFDTAYKLAKEQRRNFGDDIASALRLAKKKRWEEQEKKRLNRKSDLFLLLTDLLQKHKETLLSEAQCVSLLSEDTNKERMAVIQQHEERMVELQSLFEEADKSRKSREVPDYLCGKISFELMTDPCITPSGITYDRKDIEEHLNRVGHFDPITRTKLTTDQLIPNLAMKEVVDAFVSENDWIEEY